MAVEGAIDLAHEIHYAFQDARERENKLILRQEIDDEIEEEEFLDEEDFEELPEGDEEEAEELLLQVKPK